MLTQVWNELMDFAQFPEWNPFIRSIKSCDDQMSSIEVSMLLEGKKEMTFKPEVLVNDPGREFRWKGKFLMRGIFDGEHYFKLERTEDGVRFIHGETFSGLLSGMFFKMIGEQTLKGFNQMNEALKMRVLQNKRAKS